MSLNAKKIPPRLGSRRVEVLLEDVIGCRWTISVLRAVAAGVNRPGALECEIDGLQAEMNEQNGHDARGDRVGKI